MIDRLIILRNAVTSFCVVVLAASACATTTTRGLKLYRCAANPREVDAVVERMAFYWPDAERVFDRTEVMCSDLADEGAAGEAMWLGRPGLMRPRIRLQREHGACEGALAHELVHLALWEVRGDPCPSHAPSCGWTADVEHAIEDARTVCGPRLSQ